MHNSEFDPEGKWPVHEDYRLAYGYIRPAGDKERAYRPEEKPELPFELAKLDGAPDRELLRFAKRWGLLGYYEQLPHSRRYGKQPTEPGDPIKWVRQHALNLRILIECQELLRRKELPDLSESIGPLLPPANPKEVEPLPR